VVLESRVRCAIAPELATARGGGMACGVVIVTGNAWCPVMYGVSVGNVFNVRDEVKRKKKRKRLYFLGSYSSYFYRLWQPLYTHTCCQAFPTWHQLTNSQQLRIISLILDWSIPLVGRIENAQLKQFLGCVEQKPMMVHDQFPGLGGDGGDGSVFYRSLQLGAIDGDGRVVDRSFKLGRSDCGSGG
jgi:hypothetical protein